MYKEYGLANDKDMEDGENVHKDLQFGKFE